MNASHGFEFDLSIRLDGGTAKCHIHSYDYGAIALNAFAYNDRSKILDPRLLIQKKYNQYQCPMGINVAEELNSLPYWQYGLNKAPLVLLLYEELQIQSK